MQNAAHATNECGVGSTATCMGPTYTAGIYYSSTTSPVSVTIGDNISISGTTTYRPVIEIASLADVTVKIGAGTNVSALLTAQTGLVTNAQGQTLIDSAANFVSVGTAISATLNGSAAGAQSITIKNSGAISVSGVSAVFVSSPMVPSIQPVSGPAGPMGIRIVEMCWSGPIILFRPPGEQHGSLWRIQAGQRAR